MRICASVLAALKWVSNNWWNSQLLEWPPHTLLAVTETLKWQRWDQASEWECASLSSLDDFQSLQLFWTQNIVQSFWKQMPNEKLNLNAMTLQWAFSPLNTYSFAIILTFSVHLSVYFFHAGKIEKKIGKIREVRFIFFLAKSFVQPYLIFFIHSEF